MRSIPSIVQQDRFRTLGCYQFNQKINKKSSDVISVKSDKVFDKYQNQQLYHHQPHFKRKQQTNYLFSNKKKIQDNSNKLIRNTSFCSQFNDKTEYLLQDENTRQNKVTVKQDNNKCDKNKKNNKNIDEQDDEQTIYKMSSMINLNQYEKLYKKVRQDQKKQKENQLKLYRIQNIKLKKKIEIIQKQNKNLQQFINNIVTNMNKIQNIIQEKQNQIRQFNNQLNRKIQQNLYQKQITKCLQDTIQKLNDKIQAMIKQNQNLLYKKNCYNCLTHRQQLQLQIQQLKQNIFSLKKQLQSVQIQNIIINKLRFELQKQKIMKKQLQNENKCLKQKIILMKKTFQHKLSKDNWKNSLKKQLEYSISFSFDK